MNGRNKFTRYEKLINFFVDIFKVFPKGLRKKFFYIFRNTKGNKGIVLRYITLKSIAKSCGDNVAIREDVYIFSPENLEMGNNVSIWPMSYIDATGGIEIGDYVSIAHGASILSTSHTYSTHEIPIKYQEVIRSKTKIKNNVWIGAKVTIPAGKQISENVIIGANSFVSKNPKSNTIIGGVPAKEIKKW